MKKYLKYCLIATIISLFSTCKKKTDIDVTVFDYALNEPVANAKVALVQRKLSSFGASYSCEEIDSKTTDANGKCNFNREKLKTSSSYEYYTAVTEVYGKTKSYPCGNKTSGFLEVGSTNKLSIEAGTMPAFIIVQNNNWLSPSQVGDSLIVRILSPRYSTPGSQFPKGGGGGV